MTRTSVAVLLAVTLVVAGCGGDTDAADPDGTEVLGVSVERDEPTPSDAPDSPAPISASPSETAPPADPPTTATAPVSPAAPPPSPSPPAPPAPPPPSPEPTPDAVVLGTGTGGGYSRWAPHTQPPEECCWIELDGGPPVARDSDPAVQALRGHLVDPDPVAEGEPAAWQREVRRATCDATIEAPRDRDLVARGTATVDILYGDATVVSVAHPVDVRVAAGQVHRLPQPEPTQVDAAADRAVSCSLRFEAR